MATAKSVRIDPLSIQQQSVGPRRSSGVGKASTFGDIMGVAGAFAPLAGELTYHATGNPNAATVLNAAFTSFGNLGKGAYAGGVLSDLPGVMGSPSYGTGVGGGATAASNGGGNVPGTEVPQAELIDQMNTNNLQLLELQAVMQNNMQQWTTKSNILKSVHEAKMALIQKFTVHS